MLRSVYLAGPEVFRPDAIAHGHALKRLCAAHGFQGLFPLDAQVADSGAATPLEQARWIYRADIGLLDQADAVVANLDFFRGAEPDSGTCFEIGYAVARGKPVVGYVPEHGSLATRIAARCPQYLGAQAGTDAGGWELEEFGLPVNLMLAVPCTLVVGGVEQALVALRKLTAQPGRQDRP